MSFDPMTAIDAVHSAFGIDVVVQSAPPRTIRAVRSSADVVERFNSRDILSTSVLIEVRAAEMDGIESGARLQVDGALREVRGVPQYLDADRLVALVNTVPVTE